MGIQDLTVGDVVKLADALNGRSPQQPTSTSQDHGVAIVVLDRGFVYVGNVRTGGDFCIIENARNVRIWGTTKGLGELAMNGPTSKTQLDAVGNVKAPLRAVIHIIETEASKWNLK